MSKASIAESFFALFTDRTRAAAIMGDLIEISQTRGPIWFWLAYTRTLAALVWRTPVAFLAVCASLTVLFRFWNLYWRYVPTAWRWSTHPYLQTAVFYSALQLWFLIPFAAIRYGSGDRLVRLGVPAMLMTTGVFLGVPLLTPVLAAAGIVALAAFLIQAGTRRPAIALLTTTAVGAFALLNLRFLAHMACWIYDHKPLNASSHYRFFEVGFAFPHTLFWVVMWTMALLDMLLLAFGCIRLHRRLLLQTPLSGGSNAQLA